MDLKLCKTERFGRGIILYPFGFVRLFTYKRPILNGAWSIKGNLCVRYMMG